jgi:hypothetical protein
VTQPTPYQRQFNYTGWSSASPNRQQPGINLDADFNAVALTISQILANLALIQRDDLRLANSSVGIDQLDPIALALIGSEGFAVRGQWTPIAAYRRGDIVSLDGNVYLITVAHTSSTDIAVDLTSGYLQLVFQPPDIITYTNDPASPLGLVGTPGAAVEPARRDHVHPYPLLTSLGVSPFMQTVIGETNSLDVKTGLAIEIVTPEDFGAIADFTGDPLTATDNYAALTAAINAAATRRARLMLTRAYYSASPIVLTDTYIDWLATTDGGLAFGATDGLSITQADYTIPTTIRNVDIWTTGQEDGRGLSVVYSAHDSITNRNLPRCFIDEVSVRGWNKFEHGWENGAYVEDVHAAGIGRMWIVGRHNLDAPTQRQALGNMVVGLTYAGIGGSTAIPGDSILDTVHVYCAQDAIRITGEVEGLSITACKLVGVWRGVYSNMDTLRPGLQVYGNHINYFDAGIELYKQPQAQVFANLLYKYVGSDGLSVGVKLTLCDENYVGQNTHINSCTDAAVSGEFTCVQVANSVDCLVDAQIAEKASRIVHLTGSTIGCRVRAQTFAGGAFFTNSTANSAVIDASTGPNFVAGRWGSNKNPGVVTVTSSDTPVVSVGTPVNVRAGQRFRVSGKLAFTKGGTAGLINYSVAKSAGTATIVFYHDAAVMSGSTNPVAAGTGTLAVDAEMTVTGDGTLQLTMNSASLGSDATIAAGGGQLTMSEMQ